ncbi:leucyl aminopeptidase [Lachnospiraceae bacterium]|nr:leucyl aminopeptidase [Lachnospiraceae bacterium]
MSYQEFWKPYREETEERFPLVVERLKQMETEETTAYPYRAYFRHAAVFLGKLCALAEQIYKGELAYKSLEELQKLNRELYEEILPQHYADSYGNPSYTAAQLGEELGRLLGMLYADIRSLIPYAFEGRTYELTIFGELLIEIYNCFEQETEPQTEEIRQIIYWFYHDYGEIFTEISVLSQSSPEMDFYVRIIMDSDLSDLRYLYRYGFYITENEWKTAEFLNQMPEEEIQAMADTYTEGYRIGFEVTGKDLSKKKYVDLRYPAGFERMMRAAVKNFQKMGLEPVVSRNGEISFSGRGNGSRSVESTSPNRQYEYDHKSDRAAYLDKALVERRLEVLRTAYENRRERASWYAGPAVVETFGHEGFEPENCPSAYQFHEKQQKLNVYWANQSMQITNTYIKGEERSFTIIAYPIPEIGPQFEEIFAKTVEVNTLDYKLYQQMQQKIIDILDQGEFVHVTGKGGNTTDLVIALYPLKNPAKETIFENCVADVNIPVGEVFTSPELKGTNGRLHVTEVYLNGFKYLDLQIDFKDGMISSYSCKNFDTEEENQAFLKENLLKHHDTLPMGEFAIGTNTTAYRMGLDYGIQSKLPILIAEKTGPHFAVGDTCYSWAEDTPVFNPDGKEIVARENEISRLRKEDSQKAYFNCHTDITIPYDELDTITVLRRDGSSVDVIRDGKFTVPGTEPLNQPLR